MYNNPEQRTIDEIYAKLIELAPNITPETSEALLQLIEETAREAGEGQKLDPERSNYFRDEIRFEFFSKWLIKMRINETHWNILMAMAGGSEWEEWMKFSYFYNPER